MKKRALIFGATGQDGAYLARLLLEKHYTVFGTSRDAALATFRNLEALGIREKVQVCSANINDFRSILDALNYAEPDEIYNLAGQSSVGLSFEQPVETFHSIGTANLNLLEAIRFTRIPAKYYNACSSECFGNTAAPATENTPFRPRSPYAVSKAAAFWQVANYREAYHLHACSGILFNHESPLRPERFVTKKIVATACRIAGGSDEYLELGNLDIARDWGWAPEYVDAMWRILQHPEPDDYIVATGKTSTLREFVAAVFSTLGLDWEKCVRFNPALVRPSDLAVSRADPAKIQCTLGWRAAYSLEDIVRMLVKVESNQVSASCL